jgi:hypothetical protein
MRLSWSSRAEEVKLQRLELAATMTLQCLHAWVHSVFLLVLCSWKNNQKN